MFLRRWGVRAAGACALGAAALAIPLGATAQSNKAAPNLSKGGPASSQGGETSGARQKLAFFDTNASPKAMAILRKRAAKLDAAPGPAVSALKDALGDQGIVSIDPLTSTPRMVGRLDGFLTGPSNAAPESIARGYLQANAGVFGMTQQGLANLTLTRDYVDIDGTHHMYFLQKVNGVPVFGNFLQANMARDGRLVNIVGSPVASPSLASTSPRVSASTAIASARSDVLAGVPPVRALPGHTGKAVTFANGDKASLVGYQTVDGLRLGWQTTVRGSGAAFVHVIDAATGQVLYRRSLVNYADALVYQNYPGAAAGGTQVQVSIGGWLTSNSILTGNNTHVYSDIDDSNDSTNSNTTPQPEEIPPSGGGNWLYPITPFTFVGPLNTIYGCDVALCAWNPSVTGDLDNPSGEFSYLTNRAQSGAQLFYLINNYHDHLLASPIGFTEAAGNFQVVNSTGQGFGGDPVSGEAMDGADSYDFGFPDPNHTDNANMETPPDGQSPRMQMYLFHDPTTDFFFGPDADPFVPADGSDEADIVYHEYTHGLSNRLVVDALGFSTLGNLQAGSMGEAWSDWYAFDFLVKQGLVSDTGADGEVLVGNYVSKGADLVRTQPLDCPVGSSSPNCLGTPGAGPGGYTYGDFGHVTSGTEVHADGEIWGETLWDLRRAFGKKGWKRVEPLVTRAMELSPPNPSYLDMRNSILQADVLASGGANAGTIWNVFAHRGMGFFAGTVNGDDALPIEDFSMPPGGKAKSTMTGTVTDQDTGLPIAGARVAFGGHDSGFGVNLVSLTAADGTYSINRVQPGTYPVNVTFGLYDTVQATVTLGNKQTITQNFAMRRDWAALAGGGSITDFNGPDYTDFGCGPDGAIDGSQSSGWGSDTDDGTATGLVTSKFIVVKLPVPIDITSIAVNPSNTCGDPGSSATRGYRVETSTDGTTFAPLTEGVFYRDNRARLNDVFDGALPGVQYLRFTMLNPQVPSDPDPNAACTGPADCGSDPEDNTGVTTHCGPGNDNGFNGCVFMDMSEIEVYGAPSD